MFNNNSTRISAPIKFEKDNFIYDKQDTGFCPYCGCDTIIGESSGYPITKEFLESMHEYWSKSHVLTSEEKKEFDKKL